MKKPKINLQSNIEHNKDDLRLYLQERLMNVIDDQISGESSKTINASLFLGSVKELKALLNITPPEETTTYEFDIDVTQSNNTEQYDENGDPIDA